MINKQALVRIVVFSAILTSFHLPTSADHVFADRRRPGIELGSPFVDYAILQRQMPVPVWGWSKPGAKITVEFAGQKKRGTADKKGKWTVTLDPLAASRKERQLKVTSNAEAIAPPNQFPRAIWQELVTQGMLRHGGSGLYSLVES